MHGEPRIHNIFYNDNRTSGNVFIQADYLFDNVIKEVIGLNEDIAGRTVVIVEDIVDTGLTMQRLLDTLGTRNPQEIHIASLLVKPEKLKVDLNIEYVAMEIPNDFIVGYGLDYDGFGRNYPDIYTVVD